MSVLLGPAIVPGNKVTALQNGNKIFPAMLQAIRSAQTSITFETFIYWSGEIGEEFSQALSERARAGVPVSVIIDWVGSTKMEQSLLDSMQGVRGTPKGVRGTPMKLCDSGRAEGNTRGILLSCVAFSG
jgi:cardiolipin synthase A/B